MGTVTDRRPEWRTPAPVPVSAMGLKHELQRELELSRGRRRGHLARRGIVGVAGAIASKNDRIRVEEVGVIQNIERFRPELLIESLADSELLE